MEVSVIIPTYNGADKLPAVLKALEEQSYKKFQTVIVIDGSTDNTVAVLEELKPALDLRVFVQANSGRASVRNTGAKKSTGELLIFFDDDMIPLANCIEQHILHHKMFPASLMSGAQIDDPKKAKTPFQRYKSFLSIQWAKPLQQFEGSPLPLANLHLTAANFSIPGNIFGQLGGFDEALRDNEDLDLAIRAYQTGYSVYYRHAAFAWHYDFPTCKSFIKRQLEYMSYHDYVRRNKKDIYAGVPRFSREPERLSLLKRTFYSFWKQEFWVRLTDKGFFQWLPRAWQYHIYNWIVFANLKLTTDKQDLRDE